VLQSLTLDIAQVEYVKITPQMAQNMMSDDVIVLDVRTQNEFDSLHIINAVLLPFEQISERATNVIPDKDQIILVYCFAGVRSEIASEELIKMGYTRVFDIGGIMDWTGGIIRDCCDSVYFNYFGDDLPDDILTPFSYVVSTRINDEMPTFDFILEGVVIEKYTLVYDGSMYRLIHARTDISTLRVVCQDGTLWQEFSDLGTDTRSMEEWMYGLSFKDWNFDGFLDIGLRAWKGGSMGNDPHYYWLWDSSSGHFVRNEDLEEISWYSSVYTIAENRVISANTRYGVWGGISKHFMYADGSFVLVGFFEQVDEQDDEGGYTRRITVGELINGEMVITEHYEPLETVFGSENSG